MPPTQPWFAPMQGRTSVPSVDGLVHEVGVGDRRPHHRDEVGRAVGEDLLGLGQVHDPARDDRRHVQAAGDLCGVRHLVAVRLVHRRNDRVPHVEAADREVHEVDEARGRERDRDLGRVDDRQPAVDELDDESRTPTANVGRTAARIAARTSRTIRARSCNGPP